MSKTSATTVALAKITGAMYKSMLGFRMPDPMLRDWIDYYGFFGMMKWGAKWGATIDAASKRCPKARPKR